MAAYHVYLKNHATSTKFWSATARTNVASILHSLFNAVCALTTASPFTSAVTTWGPSASIKDGEIIIHFVHSHSDSLILQIDSSANLHSNTGSTAHFVSGKLSEVYVDAFTGVDDGIRGIAVTAFHEAMHNKLYPTDIHTAGGGGLALAPTLPYYGLTDTNKMLMAPALSKTVEQYKI